MSALTFFFKTFGGRYSSGVVSFSFSSSAFAFLLFNFAVWKLITAIAKLTNAVIATTLSILVKN